MVYTKSLTEKTHTSSYEVSCKSLGKSSEKRRMLNLHEQAVIEWILEQQRTTKEVQGVEMIAALTKRIQEITAGALSIEDCLYAAGDLVSEMFKLGYLSSDGGCVKVTQLGRWLYASDLQDKVTIFC